MPSTPRNNKSSIKELEDLKLKYEESLETIKKLEEKVNQLLIISNKACLHIPRASGTYMEVKSKLQTMR